MKTFSSKDIFPQFAAAVFVWAATAHHYINTGASIALAVAALTLLWAVFAKKLHTNFQLPKYWALAMIVLYGGVTVSSLFHLDNMENWVGGYHSVVGLLRCVIPLFALLFVGRISDIKKTVFWVLMTVVYAICLMSIYQIIVSCGGRPVSFYRTSHVTAMMIGLLLPFCIAFTMYYKQEIFCRYISMCSVVLQTLVLAFALVRGADVAVVGAGLLCLAVWWHNRGQEKFSKKALCCLLLAVIVASVLLGQCLSHSLVHESVMRGGDRPYMWAASYEIWKDYPIAGVGLNEWMDTYESPRYYPEGATERGHDHPHNVFVYSFASTGLIGGLSYIAYCLLMGFGFISWIKKDKTDPMPWAIFASFCAMTIQGFLDCNFIFKLVARSFYMLLAVAVLFSRWESAIEERKKGE